jgi:hypothetical protein
MTLESLSALVWGLFLVNSLTFATQEPALAVIQKAGGAVQRDWTRLGQPAVGVTLPRRHPFGSFGSSSGSSRPAVGIGFGGFAIGKGRDDLRPLPPATDADLARLKDLTELRTLDLARTNITDAGLVHLTGLTKLQALDLRGTGVWGAGLKSLAGLTQLRVLQLSHGWMRDAGLEHLKQITSLEELYLADTSITDAGLAHLSGLANLQTLDLSGTRVSDAGLAHLKVLRKLRTLILCPLLPREHRWSQEVLLAEQFFPLLRVIPQRDTEAKITDAGLEHLQGLTELRTLDLTHTAITNAGLAHLKELAKLKHLNLSLTAVDDAGLEHLAGLTDLQELGLAYTDVSDAGLKHLKRLTKLQWLDLTRSLVLQRRYLERVIKVRGTIIVPWGRGGKITAAGLAELNKAIPNIVVLVGEGFR